MPETLFVPPLDKPLVSCRVAPATLSRARPAPTSRSYKHLPAGLGRLPNPGPTLILLSMVLIRFIVMLVLLAPFPAAASDANRTAAEEEKSAAAREQQELLERADDLRRQQETTEALLRKQERYLQVLEQQLKQLKEASDEEPAS